MKRDPSHFIELGRQPTKHTGNRKWPVEAMLRQNTPKSRGPSVMSIQKIQKILLQFVLDYNRLGHRNGRLT